MAAGGDESILVTGFPSFRGRKMVEHLLESSSERVDVVVPAKFAAQATAFLEALPKAVRSRVTAFEGDAASIDLGLSGPEYRELGARVSRIHHMAQVTYPGVTRALAEQVNVGAMREIVEFGRTCSRLRAVVVHSSASVSGNRTGLVREDELSAGQSFRSPVEETLARAERVARTAMSHLPITVLRPVQIVGDSRTGEVDRFDGPYLLILLILSAPQELPLLLPARGDTPMHLVPIDYVVRAAQRVANHPGAVGKTLHLTDPTPLTVRQVFDRVAQSGGKRLPGGFIPSRITKALLRTPGVHLVSKSPRAFIDSIATPVRYDTRNMDAVLQGSDLQCPSFDSYVDALVAFVKQRVRERRARRQDAEVDDPLS